MTRAAISISVVSHCQAGLVSALLHDIQKHCGGESLEVILTVNVPEDLPDSLRDLSFPLKIIHNQSPRGFGENHNRAFQLAEGDFFCVVNPDIRIDSNIFPILMTSLNDYSLGVVAPLAVGEKGVVEDSARRFPTPLRILCRAMGRCTGQDYVIQGSPLYPDWVGGMFMLFRREIYQELGGFDQRYFLYYEDVDLCARIWLRGLKVALIPQVTVTHVARRSSHKLMRYLLIHIHSMMRFFLSSTFLKVMYFRMVR